MRKPTPATYEMWHDKKRKKLIAYLYTHYITCGLNIKGFKVLDVGNEAFFISDYSAKTYNQEFIYGLEEYLGLDWEWAG